MAITTTSETVELFENISQAAVFTMSEQTVIRPLVANYDLSGTPGLTASIPVIPVISAAAVAENADLSSSTFNPTGKDVTCSEIGVNVELTDFVRESATLDVQAAVGRQMGEGIAAKVDQDLAALFAGFSSTVGSGAAEITANVIFQAAATLRNANAPGPYYCILAPFQAMALKQQLAGTGNTNMTSLSDVGNQALRDGFIGTLAGMQIFESSNIANDPSAGGVVGAAFSRDALAYVNKRPFRLETERNASTRSTELVGTHAFGVSELIDAYGVGIIGDNQV
jgi:N4-gp56 family major capsid protein